MTFDFMNGCDGQLKETHINMFCFINVRVIKNVNKTEELENYVRPDVILLPRFPLFYFYFYFYFIFIRLYL